MKPHPFFSRILLLTILVAVFGAGTVDVVFSDVVPLRPYTVHFQTDLSRVANAISTGGLVGDLLGATIIILLASSLFATIANLTTGRTISHAGFTPNPNITSTVGMVPLIQLIPFLFGALVFLGTYALFERRLPGGL